MLLIRIKLIAWGREMIPNLNLATIDSINEEDSIKSHIKNILDSYFENNPHMNINSLSKKCSVSEPTIRRITSEKVKTLPTVSTVLDILTTISKEHRTKKIIDLYPGPVADFLKEANPGIEMEKTEYNSKLNFTLKDQNHYLIYKLSSNSQGVTENKVLSLFGTSGLKVLEQLLTDDFIYKKDSAYFAKSDFFSDTQENFQDHFKQTANFMKPGKFSAKSKLNPMMANYSASITADAYEKIVKIQKKALAETLKLITDESSQGGIPVFILSAIDTLDDKPAFEIDANYNNLN